jgi:hypothetical protein
MWQFETMSRVAFQAYVALDDVKSVDKIVMRQRYDFPREDIVEAYVHLCSRCKPLSAGEGRKIGVETVILIAQTREEIKLEFSNVTSRHRGIVTNNLIDLKPSYHYR